LAGFGQWEALLGDWRVGKEENPVCFSCLRLLEELLIKLNDAALQSREDSISHCIVLRAGVFLY
jgi:hypothetical protein